MDLNTIHLIKYSFKEVQFEMEIVEMCKIVDEITKVNPKIIVEIGIRYGGTMNVWRKIIPQDGLIIGIDSDNTINSVITNDPKIKFIIGNSLNYKTYQDFLLILGNNEIDLLFIDDGHVYNETKSDFYTYG